jgi:hypothetical protein
MRGRKSYNIRNIEAHLTSLQNTSLQNTSLQNTSLQNTSLQNTFTPVYQTSVRNMVFQTNLGNIVQPTTQQRQNEHINAQYGVSKYASNLVSGKMFKKI